jgi:hypothetical protein
MSDSSDPQFRYKNNLDGTFNSICVRCFRTVGTAGDIKSLYPSELTHICEPADLQSRSQLLHKVKQKLDSAG